MIAHTFAMSGFFFATDFWTSRINVGGDARPYIFVSMAAVLPLPGLSTFAGELSIAYSLYSL